MEDDRVSMYRILVKQRDDRRTYLASLFVRSGQQEKELQDLMRIEVQERENVHQFKKSLEEHQKHK